MTGEFFVGQPVEADVWMGRNRERSKIFTKVVRIEVVRGFSRPLIPCKDLPVGHCMRHDYGTYMVDMEHIRPATQVGEGDFWK